MGNQSTTDAADNQDADATASTGANQSTDQNDATTENQNADNGDNLDTSKSTENSDDDDSKSTTENKEDTSNPKFDDDLDEWATKTKRKAPETDSERALLQEIRDGQRDYSRSKQAKDVEKDVNKAIQDAKPADNKEDGDDDEDPLAKEVADLKASNAEEKSLRLRSEYFTDNSVTDAEATAMGEILKEKSDKGGKTAYDYWTSPEQLQDWHQLAKARLVQTTDTTVIEQRAAQQERERIAKEHQAGGSSRSAKTTTQAKAGGYNRNEFLKSDD